MCHVFPAFLPARSFSATAATMVLTSSSKISPCAGLVGLGNKSTYEAMRKLFS